MVPDQSSKDRFLAMFPSATCSLDENGNCWAVALDNQIYARSFISENLAWSWALQIAYFRLKKAFSE